MLPVSVGAGPWVTAELPQQLRCQLSERWQRPRRRPWRPLGRRPHTGGITLEVPDPPRQALHQRPACNGVNARSSVAGSLLMAQVAMYPRPLSKADACVPCAAPYAYRAPMQPGPTKNNQKIRLPLRSKTYPASKHAIVYEQDALSRSFPQWTEDCYRHGYATFS